MSSAPRFAVLLSGCGVYDGSEIHESVLTLLAIDRHGGLARCFAPDMPQHHVVDHLKGEPTAESRNVLVESARIARGDIQPLSAFDPADFDSLVLPGGFGAAKNLCSFAFDGKDCIVNTEVDGAIRAAHEAGLPIGAWCIAPVILAQVLKGGVVTIGNDPETARMVEAMGARHQAAGAREAVVDRERKLVSTPCYMTDAPLSAIAEGIDRAVGDLIDLAKPQ